MVGFWLLLGLLTIVTTFGLGTIVNMVFKRWWLSALFDAVLSLLLLLRTGFSLPSLEWFLLGIGGAGAVLAAWGTLVLKKRGYPLFS